MLDRNSGHTSNNQLRPIGFLSSLLRHWTGTSQRRRPAFRPFTVESLEGRSLWSATPLVSTTHSISPAAISVSNVPAPSFTAQLTANPTSVLANTNASLSGVITSGQSGQYHAPAGTLTTYEVLPNGRQVVGTAQHLTPDNDGPEFFTTQVQVPVGTHTYYVELSNDTGTVVQSNSVTVQGELIQFDQTFVNNSAAHSFDTQFPINGSVAPNPDGSFSPQIVTIYEASSNPGSPDSPVAPGSPDIYGHFIITLTGVTPGSHTYYAKDSIQFEGSPQDAQTSPVNVNVISAANQKYVSQLYRNLLHRAPEATGLDSWTQKLDNGSSRQSVTNGILSSNEYKDLQVLGYYNNFLQRQPSQSEVDGWIAKLNSGQTLEQVQAQFIGSDEFYQNIAGSNDSQFVDKFLIAIQNGVQSDRAVWMTNFQTLFLQSQSPAGGRQSRVTADPAAVRSQLVLQYFQSAEGRQQAVTTDYYLCFSRADLHGEGQIWVDQLATSSNSAVLGQILASDEYFQDSQSTLISPIGIVSH